MENSADSDQLAIWVSAGQESLRDHCLNALLKVFWSMSSIFPLLSNVLNINHNEKTPIQIY